MAAAVVCLSHATGAGGEEIGRAVAEALGFRYLDEEILLAAADKEGMEPEVLEAIERRRTGLGRLQIDVVTGGALDELLRALIRDAVVEAADKRDVVIVAHAGAMALAGDPRVLRVLVTASPETRARRVAEAERADQADAERAIDQSDKGRAAYFRNFYGVTRELPTHYDLVVNTDRISTQQAVSLICEATYAIE
jgi:cytidylate kinase